MASTTTTAPPFLLEDNTDEDFFDKLVDEDDDYVDFKPTNKTSLLPTLHSDGNESDEASAFANLSINELVNDDGVSHDKAAGGTDSHVGNLSTQTENAEQINDFGVPEKNGNSVDSAEFENLTQQLENEDGSAKVLADLAVKGESSFESSDTTVATKSSGEHSDTALLSKSSGDSESPGVKEVGWSSFYADSVENVGNGFGTYSTFFSELGDTGSGSGAIGNAVGDSLNSEPDASIWNNAQGSDFAQSLNTSMQSMEGQDDNSIQYWEYQYPGWKYDSTTGQWYPEDGCDASENVQTKIDEKEKASYMLKTVESAPGAVTETGSLGIVNSGNQEVIANWNQISQLSDATAVIPPDWDQSSQVYNGYPSHFVFDPQYPGWYYDSLALEWRSLESYSESVSSTAQVQGQIHFNQQTYNAYNQGNIYDSQGFGNQVQDQGWTQPINYYSPDNSSMWVPNNFSSADALHKHGNQLVEDNYEQNVLTSSQNGQNTIYHEGIGGYHGNFGQALNDFPMHKTNQNDPKNVSNDYFSHQNSVDFSKKHTKISQISAPTVTGRSSAGRPAHALVSFGFGGKLIVLKDGSSTANFYTGSQNQAGSSISVLNLSEVINHNSWDQRLGVCSYFQAVCQQCVPGPLSGGSVGTRDLNRWIDERIAESNSADVDYKKSEVLKLLLSLLKISCQYYGKLRSPYGADAVLKEGDAPESAVAKLFASARINGLQYGQNDIVKKCLQQMPSEEQIRATAAEVETLLVSGRKKEALQCAQAGQLWGPALVLAAQFGDQFYVETVKQMALKLFVAGSPLRTLCLLIGGQPADVFSVDSTAISGMAGALNMAPQPHEFGANGMLDDWAENLAVITANRTKNDELVLMHLGDCLWRERSDIIAAHICYLVAEASFEAYSETARMCLVGADHFKFPRTYASPEAIQRTEIYEYSKTLGNSQFVLLPFQPYKIIYAHMLAEVGKISDAMKYCQVVLKTLKTGRTPEVETLRHLASSLEERIKSHQQGGFSVNLAPKKLVGALFNLLDSTAQRVVGSMPPAVPPADGNAQGYENNQLLGHRVSTSQSTLAMSSLAPSQSLEPINDRAADSNGNLMRTRSISEPDFGRSPRQDHASSLKEASSRGTHDKASSTGGTSRFGGFGFGSQLLQKTVGLVLKPRQGNQAKLGETNKFYYDEKLKRWVEEGAETTAVEAAIPPPPPTSVFQNGTSGYNLKSALEAQASPSNGIPELKSSISLDNDSGIPPLPPTSNQYSARGRMGVRSRYVDTFNKGGANVANAFPVPSAPIKPPSGGNPKFFMPTPVSAVDQQADASMNDTTQETSDHLSAFPANDSFTSAAPPSSFTMPRFSSMNNIINQGTSGGGSFPAQSRRVASWSGSFNDSLSTGHGAQAKPLGEVLGMHPSYVSGDGSVHSSTDGGHLRDELDEVEL